MQTLEPMIKNYRTRFQPKFSGQIPPDRHTSRFPALHPAAEWGLMGLMSWKRGTSNGLRAGGAAVALSLGCLTAGAAAHPVTYQMAFIAEADDGLTRQSVASLARPEAAPKLAPPSEYSVEVLPNADATRHTASRHHRHRARREVAQAKPAPVRASASAPAGKAAHPWVMVKLIAFTNWWNGWSERNLRTKALDVHLDRPAQHDA